MTVWWKQMNLKAVGQFEKCHSVDRFLGVDHIESSGIDILFQFCFIVCQIWPC